MDAAGQDAPVAGAVENMSLKRFPIRFDPWYVLLSSALLLPPSGAYVEVNGGEVRVQMGWAFRSRFPKTAVAFTEKMEKTPMSRGVHGFAGRWLVNGSGQGILALHLAPAQRGYVTGFPVRLRQLMVSVTQPEALAAALSGKTQAARKSETLPAA